MTKYTRNTQVIDGTIDDNLVMMHLEKGKYFGLNPVGKRIWELIETSKDSTGIIQCLMTEFDVTEEQCTREVAAFLDKAVACDIVTQG